MPDDGVSNIPVPTDATAKESVMDPSIEKLLIGQLGQTGLVAQNNFVTVAKAQDYDYLENKRMVTLDEAVGVREVQSQYNPGGPTAREKAAA